MDEQIEKLRLHVYRLEQCIRQVERLQEMGISNEVIENKIDEYLDEMLNVKKRIKFLENELKRKGDA